jgi:hypothetical protein
LVDPSINSHAHIFSTELDIFISYSDFPVKHFSTPRDNFSPEMNGPIWPRAASSMLGTAAYPSGEGRGDSC